MATESVSTYNPSATFEVAVTDVEYLTVDGQSFLARIYRPQGAPRTTSATIKEREDTGTSIWGLSELPILTMQPAV